MSNEGKIDAPAVPQTVYLVENRTCLLAYASREDADKAVASMPASVGGGFLVSPVQVFGAPAPAPAPAQEVADMVPRAALHEVERERDYYKSRTQNMYEHQNGEVWYWQGDGEDHPESWVNSLPVVIRADQLRELMAKPAQEVGLTNHQFDLICQAIDKADTATMDGDYMLDSDDCIAVVRVMQALFDVAAGFAGKYGKELDAVLAAQQMRIDAAVSASLEAIAEATGATHD